MEELGSNYLMLSIILIRLTASVHLYALVDSGGSAIRFINTDFTAMH